MFVTDVGVDMNLTLEIGTGVQTIRTQIDSSNVQKK